MFLALAAVFTLVAVSLIVLPLVRSRDEPGRRGGATIAVLLLLPGTVIALYSSVSGEYPGRDNQTAAGIPALADLEARVRSEPLDQTAWIELGAQYVNSGRYADARDAFREALELDDQSDESLRIAFAETAVLADPETALQGESGRIFDEVLAGNPMQPKALWYGGMAALSRGDQALAQARWTRLLGLSPPAEIREVIEQQLARWSPPVLPGTVTQQPSPESATGAAAAISVRIDIVPELAGRIGNESVLFLIARSSDRTSGPPIAVVRSAPVRLPGTFSIGEADLMIPGPRLATQRLNLIARISQTGNPDPKAGDLVGRAGWEPENAIGPGGHQAQILIDRLVD
jgi:cytochrome c-type biogenesis protein CcmH